MERITSLIWFYGLFIIPLILLSSLLYLSYQLVEKKGNTKRTIIFITILYIIYVPIYYPSFVLTGYYFTIESLLTLLTLFLPLAIPYFIYFVKKIINKNITKIGIIGFILSSLPIVAVLIDILRM